MVADNSGRQGRHRLSLRQIEAFRAVVLEGTVSEAADRMRISQPAVSRLVADLERAVGFSLFDRRNRRLHLRQEGTLLYREVERAFLGLDRIADRAEEIRDFRTGHLRIAGSPALSLGLLSSVIVEFQSLYAGATVSVQVHGSHRVAEWVSTGQLDLGFAASPVHQSGVIIEPLEALSAVCVLPADHPLLANESVTPDLLTSERFIALTSESLLRSQTEEAFRAAGVAFAPMIETSMSAHAMLMVAKGHGVAFVDPLTALAFRELNVAVRSFLPRIRFEFAVLRPARGEHSRLADAFVEIARERLATAAAELGVTEGAHPRTGPHD